MPEWNSFFVVTLLLMFDRVKATLELKQEALRLSKMTATEFATIYKYSPHNSKVGEWTPPPPPKLESSGLIGKVPIPTDINLSNFGFKPSLGGNRNLLMEAGGGGGGKRAKKGNKVPHNWFGQKPYMAPKFEIATGVEECKVCAEMITADSPNVNPNVKSNGSAEGSEAASKALGLELGQKNLCAKIGPMYFDMCKGYLKYLHDCPSFIHNICHEDVGGSERLRAPCPKYLKCYYCLRINPLYCGDD